MDGTPEPIIADFVEPLGQHMLQKAPDELMGRQGHGLPALSLGVPVAEADSAVLNGEQTAIRPHDAVDSPGPSRSGPAPGLGWRVCSRRPTPWPQPTRGWTGQAVLPARPRSPCDGTSDPCDCGRNGRHNAPGHRDHTAAGALPSEAEPTRVEHPQTHPSVGVLDQRQQGPDLSRTQHDGQSLGAPGSHKVENGPRALQRPLVEAPNPLEVNAEGALGDFLLVQQEEAILAELRFAELVGSAFIVASPRSCRSSSIRRLRAVIAILLFVLGTIVPKRATANRKIWGHSGVRKRGRKVGISIGETRTLPRSAFVQHRHVRRRDQKRSMGLYTPLPPRFRTWV
jgi:hypothetical protein